MQAKVKLVHVPYKGGGPAMQGFLGKAGRFLHRDAGLVAQADARPARRSPSPPPARSAPQLMSDVPTVAESGLPGLRSAELVRVLRPERLPKDVVQTLNREIVKALKDQVARSRCSRSGRRGRSPARPRSSPLYTKREFETWGKVIKEAGIKPSNLEGGADESFLQSSPKAAARASRCREVPTPSPGPGQVLVKVRAAGLNRG